MIKLTRNIKEVSLTISFSTKTMPAGLLKNHSTKKDLWGKLVVESGIVHYTVTDPAEVGEYQINAGDYGVIVPKQLHHVELMKGDTVFHIEFMK